MSQVVGAASDDDQARATRLADQCRSSIFAQQVTMSQLASHKQRFTQTTSKFRRSSDNLIQIRTTPNQRQDSKRMQVARRRRSGLPVALALLAALLVGQCWAQNSVVRPTKFTDVKAPLISGQSSTSQQPGEQQQQASPSTAAAAAAASSSSSAPVTSQDNPTASKQIDIAPGIMGGQNLAGAQSRISGNPFPQASPSSTTIYPVKTRLCSNSNGFRHDSPLGMQSYGIDDLALSASSYSNEQTGPQKARLNLDGSGGAWCPGRPISGSLHGSEWIQVKLNRSVVITAIETQGRFAMGSGKEFAPGYSIEYSRNNGLSWHKWRDYTGIGQVLRGNDDVMSPVKNELTPPIVGANVIRILPFSQHLRTVCLRFELHGCTYDEGAPIAYAGPDGVIEGRWGHLIDTTYDGFRHQGQLHGGLGQLVDGIKGADNFSHNQGLEWVGWKSKDGDLHLEFTFKTLRNFTGALFHSNNLFSSGVEALQAMDVHYGIDIGQSLLPLRDALEEPRRREAALSRTSRQAGSYHPRSHFAHNQHLQDNAQQLDNQASPSTAVAPTNTLWSSKVLRIEYEPDKRLETARPVTVHLDHQLANKLKFVLKFASKWILISEVEFLSYPVELMSFSSLSQEHTPPLLDALKSSKNYDEYVAILREHQLRRIAANAFFGISPPSTNNNINIMTSSSTTTQQSVNSHADQQPDMSDDQPMFNSETSSTVDVNYPSIDPSTTSPSPVNSPYDNILLAPGRQREVSGGGWMRDPNSPSSIFNLPYPGLFGPPTDGASLDKRLSSQQHQTITTPPNNSSIGFATVISLIIVAMILLISLLIGLSRYHMHRQQPKLGFPGFPFNTAPGSSSPSGSSTGNKASDLAPIKGLLSVFSNNAGHQTTNHLHSTGAIDHNQHPYQLEPYNTIFAPGHAANSTSNSSGGSTSNQSSSMSVRNTLGRLAGLASGNNNNNNRNQSNGGGPHQLLVSVKDTSGKTSFGYQTNRDNAVSTQLIVGLNQANPLAHQQIYSNNSSVNCSNQTYATQYTGCGGLSMTSSTNGLGARLPMQQPYNEYATPEIDGPPTSSAANFRSSCRAPNSATMSHHVGNHFNNSFTLSNRLNQHQQQQLVNHQAGDVQHNYELIYHDNSSDSQQQQQNHQEQLFHARTLSKQMRYTFNQQDQQANQLGAMMNIGGNTNNNKKIIDLR